MDQSHLFSVEIAKEYGPNAAIMIRHFQFWIAKNKFNGKHQHEGRTWSYCSVKAFTEIFPYWTARQVRVILDKLIGEGVLIKDNYNVKGYDHTTWYAFKDEKRFVIFDKSNGQKGQKDSSKTSVGIDGNGQPIPNPIPDSYTDKLTKSDELKISPKERLELDLQIAKEMKFFVERVMGTERNPGIFRYFNKQEAQTFKRITIYLTEQCQAGKLPVSIFKDAVEWAMVAKSSMVPNKKGLFVAKVKEQTGFKKQKKLLSG